MYVTEDGMSLVPVEREVPFGDHAVEQATAHRRGTARGAAASPQPPISVNASVRGLFFTERGDAFVDLSAGKP